MPFAPSPGPGSEDREVLADELLAIRCQLGEPEAFEALVQRWHLPLWKYLRRVLGADEPAADMLQDVWLRVIRAFPALRDPARLRPWLFGIARRAVMDRLRRQYAEPRSETLDDEAHAGPEGDDGLDEALGAMHEELAAMPWLEREVLVLFYLQEFSLVQASEVLGVPVGTVKSRLFRARRMLRERLDRKDIG